MSVVPLSGLLKTGRIRVKRPGTDLISGSFSVAQNSFADTTVRIASCGMAMRWWPNLTAHCQVSWPCSLYSIWHLNTYFTRRLVKHILICIPCLAGYPMDSSRVCSLVYQVVLQVFRTVNATDRFWTFLILSPENWTWSFWRNCEPEATQLNVLNTSYQYLFLRALSTFVKPRINHA